MPAQRAVPSAPARRPPLTAWIVAAGIVAAAGLGYIAGVRRGSVHEVMWAAPLNAQRIGFVREGPCGVRRCRTLWIGGTREDAVQVASLSGDDRCEEIAWAPDGYRVGFVIDGYQLRIFDGHSGEPKGQANLIEPEGSPTSRIARGVTFSTNGAAVTFDDCPRYTSGCRSDMVAVR